jgi:hypothetical protein
MESKVIRFEEVVTRRRDWKAKAIRFAEAKKPFVLIGFDMASHRKFYDSLKKYNLNQSFDVRQGNSGRACFWASF